MELTSHYQQIYVTGCQEKSCKVTELVKGDSWTRLGMGISFRNTLQLYFWTHLSASRTSFFPVSKSIPVHMASDAYTQTKYRGPKLLGRLITTIIDYVCSHLCAVKSSNLLSSTWLRCKYFTKVSCSSLFSSLEAIFSYQQDHSYLYKQEQAKAESLQDAAILNWP